MVIESLAYYLRWPSRFFVFTLIVLLVAVCIGAPPTGDASTKKTGNDSLGLSKALPLALMTFQENMPSDEQCFKNVVYRRGSAWVVERHFVPQTPDATGAVVVSDDGATKFIPVF